MADDETLTGSSSDPNPCPICLAPFTQDSYLDQCFHKFCYRCIVKWINIVSRGQSSASSSLKCPLCKVISNLYLYSYVAGVFKKALERYELEACERLKLFTFSISTRVSILMLQLLSLYTTQNSYSFRFLRSNTGISPTEWDMERENFSIICGYDGTSFQQHYVGKSLGNSEFFSEAHRYRLKCYYTDPGDLADKLYVSRYWKFCKYLQQNIFLPDWLRREIQAVMQEEDVDIIMHHVLGVIDSLRRDWLKKTKVLTETQQEEFRVSVCDAVRPFLTGRTERFVNELELFLASGLNIDAFDKVYRKHLGWKFLENNEDHLDEHLEHTPAVPYLYILDVDSDDN